MRRQNLHFVLVAMAACGFLASATMAQQPASTSARVFQAPRGSSTTSPFADVLQQPTGEQVFAAAERPNVVKPSVIKATASKRRISTVSSVADTRRVVSASSIESGCGCRSCGKSNCCGDGGCCGPAWRHCSGVFAGALFLRPGNLDVVYAVEQNGCDPMLAAPTGPVGQVSPNNEMGWVLGGAIALTPCSSIGISYTQFESSTQSSITANGVGNVLNSQVAHPGGGPTCGAGSLAATANLDVDFDLADIYFRRLLRGTQNTAINYMGGFRYGKLQQQFQAAQLISTANGLTTVSTDIDFEGFGIVMGLDGQRISPATGLLVYGRGTASFLGGDFKNRYRQVNQFGGTGVIANSLEDYRVVTILEAELGIGWQSAGGGIRITGGYQVAGWFNSITTSDYIDAVRQTNFNLMDDETITFDGAVVRLELRR